ncbi:MAG: PilZ domain-containing protein [Spirochaetales bacterium]|nr:PilZ domain-containing protein [Spirochaetales bacterium]
MNELTRAARRDRCFIRAFANGHSGQIRDINGKGMKISLFGRPEIAGGEQVNVKIIPDDMLGLKPFYVRGTVRWVRREDNLVNFGLQYSDGANMSAVLPLKKLIRTWR